MFLSRVIAAAVIIVLLTGVLVARLVQLQVMDHQRFSELSQGNRLRIEPLPPTRGLILDRNGIVIAENLPTWQLVLIPEQVPDLHQTLTELQDIGLIDDGEFDQIETLIRSHRRFERVRLRNLSEAEAATFAVRRHLFPGVDIQEGLVRHYPFGDMAAHAVGYVGSISAEDLERIDRRDYAGTPHIGKTGVERSYENALHGTVGYRQQIVNAQGRVLQDVGSDRSGASRFTASQGGLETRWPVPGDNVVLALDMRLQLVAHEAIGDMRAAVVAIDPRNGDVLALVSTPSFDPNRFAVGMSRNDFLALRNDRDRPLFNRTLSGQYPPGSTIKPFLGLGAMYHDSLNPHQGVPCGGFFTLPGNSHRYRDWRPQGHGLTDMHKALVESCDVYFYQLAVGLGIDLIEPFLKSFGLGQRTGIDIPGEAGGIVPGREWKRQNFSRREDQSWYPGETVIVGIGQGYMETTPLQLAHATATLAARGQRYQPRLVTGTENGVSREMHWVDPVDLPSVTGIDPDQWQLVHDASVGVTTELRGTARTAMLGSQYAIAGKTGTSQLFSIGQDERYIEDEVDERLRDHGLFIAYAPAGDPTIAIAVIVENGGGGGRTAAPVTRRILDAYFAHLAETDEEFVARQH